MGIDAKYKMTTENLSIPSGDLDSDKRAENSKPDDVPVPIPDGMSSQRVFKKVSANQMLTLYLSSRDLVVSPEGIDRLHGVLLVDPEFVEDRKVYGQVTLTFRYGREDEEVMGLKFCNEAIMCLVQLYPPHLGIQDVITPLQEALVRRLGPNAYPFQMVITRLSPPSVQLVPAKEYNGAPIGTSYDVRAYVDKVDEKLHRRSSVRMGIRVVQKAFAPPSPNMYVPGNGKMTCRGKSKQHRKALLFGCKSAPLDSKFAENEQNVPDESVENTPTHQTNQMLGIPKCPQSRYASQQISLGEHTTNRMKADSEEMDGDQGVFLEDTHDRTENKETPELVAIAEDNELRISNYYRTMCSSQRPSLAAYLAGVPSPHATAEKFYLLGDGKVALTATLGKAVYAHGEDVQVAVQVRNGSNKTVKGIKIFVVQHVDVCMFSNGKFKNVVAMLNAKDDCPIHNGQSLMKTYTLTPMKSSTKNWIALEESYNKTGTSLASTVTSMAQNGDDRNVFAIYVSYYVKVKLLVGMMGGAVSLKLPFTLMHTCSDTEHAETLTKVAAPRAESLTKVAAPHDGSPENVPAPYDGSSRTVEEPHAEEPAQRSGGPVKPEKDGT